MPRLHGRNTEEPRDDGHDRQTRGQLSPDLPEARDAKIVALKHALASGTYSVSAAQIAAKILQEHVAAYWLALEHHSSSESISENIVKAQAVDILA